jgi:hypothetical protein
MSDISPFIVESLRGMFAGVSPAFWALDAGCVWLVKLRMLLFALAFLLTIFALFIAPIGRPVGFNFLSLMRLAHPRFSVTRLEGA